MHRIALISAFLFVACGAPQKTARPALAQPEGSSMVAACEAGTARSCLIAAEQAGDPAEQARLFAKACELGESTGCALGGGTLSETDAAAARQLFDTGCELGDATSCYGSGLVSAGVFGQVEPEYSRAAASFERGCTAGLPDACGDFAGLLGAGRGVPVDLERAAALRAKACDDGHAASCTRLGLEAWRHQSDPEAARALLERSCGADLPDPNGCGWFGWMLWSGIGGAADEGRGLVTLDVACAGDSAIGCALRATVHLRNGDESSAHELLRKACELSPGECETMQKQVEGAPTSDRAAPD